MIDIHFPSLLEAMAEQLPLTARGVRVSPRNWSVLLGEVRDLPGVSVEEIGSGWAQLKFPLRGRYLTIHASGALSDLVMEEFAL